MSVTPEKAAKILGFSRPTIMKMIREGSIKAHKNNMSGHWEVDEESLQQHQKKPKAEKSVFSEISLQDDRSALQAENEILKVKLAHKDELLTLKTEEIEFLRSQMQKRSFWKLFQK